MDLQGKKALGTGGSRGIGRATALLLAQEGADIAINYVSNEQAAQEVAKRVEALGRRTLTLQGDVGDPDQVAARFAVIGERWGGVDVLVNNAGGRCDGAVLETDESEWERTLGVHVLGTVRCSRLALPAMIEKRQGVIVNISSTAGLRGLRGGGDYARGGAA